MFDTESYFAKQIEKLETKIETLQEEILTLNEALDTLANASLEQIDYLASMSEAMLEEINIALKIVKK